MGNACILPNQDSLTSRKKSDTPNVGTRRASGRRRSESKTDNSRANRLSCGQAEAPHVGLLLSSAASGSAAPPPAFLAVLPSLSLSTKTPCSSSFMIVPGGAMNAPIVLDNDAADVMRVSGHDSLKDELDGPGGYFAVEDARSPPVISSKRCMNHTDDRRRGERSPPLAAMSGSMSSPSPRTDGRAGADDLVSPTPSAVMAVLIQTNPLLEWNTPTSWGASTVDEQWGRCAQMAEEMIAHHMSVTTLRCL